MTASTAPALPRVAVLLAACNGERWLDEQTQSIESQQGVTVQLYISVDESRDNTWGWCEAYAAENANVTLLSHGQSGSAARNFFRLLRDVSLEEFDHVAFADQDDIWLPGKLKRAIKQLDVHQASGYSSNVLAFWPDGRRHLLDKAQPPVRWDHYFEAAGPGCSYVFTAPFARALQGFVRQHQPALQSVALHDWLTYAYARQNGWAWFIDAEPGLLYRQHGNNEFGANTSWRSMLRRVQRIRQGWWFEQVSLIARLVGVDPAAPLTGAAVDRRQLARMLINARQCRRRPRDQLLFAGLCVIAWITVGSTK
jgi:rhamnosyltransferase